ncbi:MAG TPA: DUF3562 domain-containing protein [Steroidobacteraceae bacterium]|nr:DUF3562 domain-containing protein [Steroidobacteraceae bacterium]
MKSSVTFSGRADKSLAELETLARDVAAPLDEVTELYRIEHERLESTAKIKTFVPVFASRQVRTIFALRHNLIGERVGRA